MMKFFPRLPLLALLMGGCTQYATITALRPAESPKTASLKTLSVGTFEQDTIALSQNIQTSLSTLHPYFTIVPPRLNPHGEVRGAVTSHSITLTPYNVERYECLDRQCYRQRTYLLTCINKTSSVSANIQIVDPKTHELLFASNEYASQEQHHCPDDNYPITSDEDHYTQLSARIAQSFTARLVPATTIYRVALMNRPDITYSYEEERLLETALEAIQNNRADKAITALTALADSTAHRSFAALYDLGVACEMAGRLDEARGYYRTADKLAPPSTYAINNALIRIEQSIRDRDTALTQLPH